MSDREKVLNDLQELCEYLFHEYKVCYKGDEEDTYNRFLAANNALNLLKEQPQWISAKDRLPDAAGYECLVCAVNENYNQTHVFTAHTGYGEPGWWTGNVHYMSRVTSPSDNRLHPALNVTHWMPLPEPPEGVKPDG